MTAKITVEPTTLIKGQWWFQVPERKVDFTIEWLQKFPAGYFYSLTDDEALAARHCTKNLEHYFKQELAQHE